MEVAAKYHTIVIGAGSGGASCAKILNDNGVKTLIIEKKKLPRVKCCSGFLSEMAIAFIEKNFAVIPSKLYCSNKDIAFRCSVS